VKKGVSTNNGSLERPADAAETFFFFFFFFFFFSVVDFETSQLTQAKRIQALGTFSLRQLAVKGLRDFRNPPSFLN